MRKKKKMLDRVVAMAGKQPALSPDPKEYDAQGSFQPAKETKKTPLDPKKSEAEGSFKPAKETKKIPLDPEHPERYAIVGANLDSK